MTNFAALQIVYNSKVCTDNYGNLRSAFLLLLYIPSAKTFLAYRKVKSIKFVQEVVENQVAPHHDIRHMSGINISRLLPPCASPGASGSTPPGDLRPRKRKASFRGETSRPEPLIDLEDSGTDTLKSGAKAQPHATQQGTTSEPRALSKGPRPSRAPAPV